MASRRNELPHRKGKDMAKVFQRSWLSQEDDFSDTSSISSTEAIKSHSEPPTDDEDEPQETVEIGEESPKLEPPTEADMEEMKIIASSSTTDEILTKMLGRHDIAERRSAVIETMQTVRSSVQQKFNGAINALIKDYVQNYFKPAVQNLKDNLNESEIIDKDILDKISCDLLDNSKLQYNAVSVRPKTPIPLPILTYPDSMPLYSTMGSEDFNDLPSWLPQEPLPMASSAPLDSAIGMGRPDVVTPVELTQRLTELQNGDYLLRDVSMVDDSKPHANDDIIMDDSKSSDLSMSGSEWPGNGRLVKRWPIKRAYCFRGDDDDDGEEGGAAHDCDGPKKSRSKYSNLSNNLLISLMTLLYKHKMFWNASIITTTTKFLTDIQANRVFGYAMDTDEHFSTYHPDLIRYMPDLEDRDWLLQQKLIERPNARVLLLVYDEVGYIKANDCRYRLKRSIDLSVIRTFTLPEFIIEKMKKFFSQLNLASRGLITFQKPVGRELNSALRRCLPLVPAHYSAFANWAIAAAATERNRSPSEELLNIFKVSFAAVAAMVKKRRRLEQLAERRALEEAIVDAAAEVYSCDETDELEQEYEESDIDDDAYEAVENEVDNDRDDEKLEVQDGEQEQEILSITEGDTRKTNSFIKQPSTLEYYNEENVMQMTLLDPYRDIDIQVETFSNDLTDFPEQQPLQLTTVEILSKIPATITVTARKPSIEPKTAFADAKNPEFTIVRKNALKKCCDSMPDVTIFRRNGLRNGSFRPQINPSTEKSNEISVPFEIPPELTIFRRRLRTSGCGDNTVLITGDAE